LVLVIVPLVLKAVSVAEQQLGGCGNLLPPLSSLEYILLDPSIFILLEPSIRIDLWITQEEVEEVRLGTRGEME